MKHEGLSREDRETLLAAVRECRRICLRSWTANSRSYTECRMDRRGEFSVTRRRLDDDLACYTKTWLDLPMAFVGGSTLADGADDGLGGVFTRICAPTFEELRIKLAAQGIL